MKYLCALFGLSRQAWYDSRKRKEDRQMEEVLVLSEVKKIRKDHKAMGTEKLQVVMQPFFDDNHIKMGRDKLNELLGEHSMLVRLRKYKPRTTNSNHPYHRYKNLVKDLTLTQANQLWVSDITYISTELGNAYLSLITDSYSHKIVGWCLYPSLESKGTVNALNMALESNPVRNGLIHHSDRGIQYCCHDYVNALKTCDIGISMTENGDPYENAIAERVNGILKYEYELNQRFADYYHALEQVKKAVELYNNQRPHASCGYLVPAEAHGKTGVLKKYWTKKNYSNKLNLTSDDEIESKNQNLINNCYAIID